MIRHLVALALVLMHAVVGHAAGSAVCLGGGSCHRPETIHLGIGHSHRHGHDHGEHAGHGHSHGHEPEQVASSDAERDWQGCQVEGHDHGCGCMDAWIPHGRSAGDSRSEVGGPDVVLFVLEPVDVVVGGVIREAPQRAMDQRPPGALPGLASTVLLI